MSGGSFEGYGKLARNWFHDGLHAESAAVVDRSGTEEEMTRNSVAHIGLLSVVIAACLPGEGGIDLPHQLTGETYPGDRRELNGLLEVADNGCLNLALEGGTYFVIWPTGSSLDNRVRLPNGEVIAEGDIVVGTGALTPTAPLVANRNGYWANAIGYCSPNAAEVIVLDSARRGA